MKFDYVNVHNIVELVPEWATDPLLVARTLDRMFSTPEGLELMPSGDAVYQPLEFWVEVDATAAPSSFRICVPDGDADLRGQVVITCQSLAHEKAQILLPLNPFMKGYTRIQGKHCVYLHSFQTETPIGYIGITKQRWFERYGQHLSSAKAGSPFLFHRGLREHLNQAVLHRVFLCELDLDQAYSAEEDFVRMFSMYPLGFNMIPGGRAGFAYLAKLGLQARSAEERDNLTEDLSAKSSLRGRANPLCAALWEKDPNFVERVICGHSGRLTADQIRLLRAGASLGRSIAILVAESGASNERQVRDLLAGRTYRRIG